MATVGHQWEECNRGPGGGEAKEQPGTEPLLVSSNFRGGGRASSHFVEGETEEQARALSGSWEGRWQPRPTQGAVLPCWQEVD